MQAQALRAIADGVQIHLETLADSAACAPILEAKLRELTTTDVRNAAYIFRDIAEATDFVDGRVSIEVDPRLAHETEATEKQAVELWEKVNRPNAMIKIPATLEGLPAITATLANEFAEAAEGLHQASLIYLGLVLFFITFVVLSLSKILLSRLKKSEGSRA